MKIIRNLTLSALTFLGSDKHYTITGLSTIDRSRSGIFQDLHGSDVVRVDAADVAQADTVHYVKRIGRHIGGVTTHTHRRTAARSCRGLDYLHTGSLTLQGGRGVADGTVLHVLCFHLRNGTRYGTFLLHTVTYHHHFVQRLAVFFQYNVHHTGNGLFLLGYVADVRENDGRSLIHIQCIITVNIGNTTVGSTFLYDTYTNHRFIQVVSHLAGHFHGLGLCQRERKAD